MSNVCLGTMTWGNQNSEEEAHAQLDEFLQRGGNFIDTAEVSWCHTAPPIAPSPVNPVAAPCLCVHSARCAALPSAS